jgi:hypothetical protein
MNETNNKKQGDRVYFEMGVQLPTGYGKVCGSVGPVIIIELEAPIKGYEFTHTYVLDTQIKTPPVETPKVDPTAIPE